ncbi:MAG: methylated-DNA--[protein]-cysteine S-methyltransferase [Marinicella sp.]
MFIEYLESPIGLIEITATDMGICGVYFIENSQHDYRPNHITALCRNQLQEYFSGNRKTFDLPLDQKGTQFQKDVWHQLLTINYGKTATYGDISQKIGNPKAVRAVGAANGKNPISIIVPCHRVIGANGTLTGYAGGLNRKKWLLQHEGIVC